MKRTIFLFLILGCMAADEITLGLFVSKAAKHSTNSYCKEGFYYEIAAQVAAESVNADPELLGNRKLVLDVRDIKKDRYETLKATNEIIMDHLESNTSSPLAALLGTSDDYLNELVQLSMLQYSIPQISFKSHSTELSHVTEYPFFCRLSASQNLVATSLLSIIQHYRWQRFNVIAADDSDGSNAVEELRKAIERMPREFREYITFGATLRYPSQMTLPLSESVNEQLNSILESIEKTGNRINILFADPLQASAFLYSASQHGMTGLGWVYLGTDWNTILTYAGLPVEYRDTVQKAMDGMVGISPFLEKNARLLDKITAYVDRHPEIQTNAEALCGERLVFKRELFPEYIIVVYDSVITTAKGIQSVLEVMPNATFATAEERQLLYSHILEVKYEGESGYVEFDPLIGDRLPIKMEVVNIYHGEIIDIGDMDFKQTNNYSFIVDSIPHWPGGSTAIPTDRYDETEEYLALYMVLTLSWMAIAFIVGAFLERWEIHRLPESGAVVIFGIIAGLIIRAVGSHMSSTAVFDPKSFTLMLLPIIIFESGYNMQTKGVFFKNIGTILIYAIFGTLFSVLLTTLALAAMFYFHVFKGIDFSIIECSIFSMLISATDPVCTLALFGTLSVEPMLSMLVYGESVINDAVSIVGFKTMSKFLLIPLSFQAVLQAIGTFLIVFIGSALLGTITALFCCLILKWIHFTSAVIETILVFLTAYIAFELTECLELSGITATLACGITMNYFGLRNLSKSSQDFSQQAVKIASSLADTLIFFQIGENVFLTEDLRDVPWMLVLSVYLIGVVVRCITIFGFTYCINLKRTKSKISLNSQLMMVHAGLRGAMAYSLAVMFPSHNQSTVTRVTIWVVILTIFIQGCTTYDLLHLLHIPLHCNYSSNNQNTKKRSVMATDGSKAAWILGFFDRYVIPFFTKDQKQIEEPLLSPGDMEVAMRDSYMTPRESYLSVSSSARHLTPSVTCVVKGKDGKATVHNVANVEADVEFDDKDMFVISDNDVEESIRGSNMDVTRQSLSSNLSMRQLHWSVCSTSLMGMCLFVSIS